MSNVENPPKIKEHGCGNLVQCFAKGCSDRFPSTGERGSQHAGKMDFIVDLLRTCSREEAAQVVQGLRGPQSFRGRLERRGQLWWLDGWLDG